VGAALHHANEGKEGQKHMTKLTVSFRDLLTRLKPEQGEENKFTHYSPQEVSKYVTSPTLLSESEKKKNTAKIRLASHDKRYVETRTIVRTVT
jgi:hypothetical protein